jgi:hypothetical protein
LKRLDWTKARHHTIDPAREIVPSGYGILDDKKAGRKGTSPKKASWQPPTKKQKKPAEQGRAFPDAHDGRNLAKGTPRWPKPKKPK